MEDLFSKQAFQNAPLAERMRADSLEQFLGQKHIVGSDSLLSRAIKTNMLGSCIFYGPPGSGKTTLANIISKTTQSNYVKLNAVSSGVAEAKKVIESARNDFRLYGKKTYLLLDECHRWNKAQSDSVLGAIEEGCIIFIGSTTENPFVNMTRAIVSRCRVFEFKPLKDNEIKDALKSAITDKERGYGKLNIKINEEALAHYAWASSGDLRMAYNALELAVRTTPINKKDEIVIDKKVAEQSIQKKAMSIDEDIFYDMLSAFCKSLRGSDAEAGLYWSNRLIEAGCDPLVIARRMMAHASEDIGMADSNALLISICAHYAVKNMGLPEGSLSIAHAIIYLCEAPKSNSVYKALSSARRDIEQIRDDNVPNHLKNHPTLEDKKVYKYPHDFGGYIKQQYLPDSLKDSIYYVPSKNGREKDFVRKKLS